MNLRWLFSTDQRTLHVNEKCLTSHLRLWIDDFWQKKKHQKMWHDVLQLKKTDCSHRRCSIKKVFLKISQNTQENICARVYFLIKLNASACNFIMKESLVQVFSSEFFKIFNTTFFTEHPWACFCKKHSNILRSKKIYGLKIVHSIIYGAIHKGCPHKFGHF